MDNRSNDYFLEIEAHFAERRGTPFVLSSKDWALIKSWSEESIPLPVIVEAIDTCFEKRMKSGRKRMISSLSYCRHAVKELWEERRDLQVGGDATLPEADPVAHLKDLARAIDETAAGQEQTVAGYLRTVANEIRAAPANRSVPRIEEELMELERRMIDELMDILPSSERDELQREADQLLSGYTNLDPEIVRKSRDANLRRLLRKRYSLPRLSLFG